MHLYTYIIILFFIHALCCSTTNIYRDCYVHTIQYKTFMYLGLQENCWKKLWQLITPTIIVDYLNSQNPTDKTLVDLLDIHSLLRTYVWMYLMYLTT